MYSAVLTVVHSLSNSRGHPRRAAKIGAGAVFKAWGFRGNQARPAPGARSRLAAAVAGDGGRTGSVGAYREAYVAALVSLRRGAVDVFGVIAIAAGRVRGEVGQGAAVDKYPITSCCAMPVVTGSVPGQGVVV